MNINDKIKSIINYYGLEETIARKLNADLNDLFINELVKTYELAKKEHSKEKSDFACNSIIAAVEKVFNYQSGEILIKTKEFNPVLPRQFAQYFMLKDGVSPTVAGKVFNQHRATVNHSKKVIEDYLWQGSYITEHDEINRLIIKSLFIDQGTPAPADCEL